MATPSPSGYFREVNALLTELCAKRKRALHRFAQRDLRDFYSRQRERDGGTVGALRHAGSNGKKRISSGEIMFATVGGIILPTRRRVLQGAHARRQDVYRHVFVAKPRHTRVRRLRDKKKGREKICTVRLDEKVCCADDVRRLGHKKRRLYFRRHQNGVYRQRVRKIPFSGRQGGSRRAAHRPARFERGKKSFPKSR